MAKTKVDRYAHRWTVKSFTDSSVSYVVAQLKTTLEMQCSCKAWIFQRKKFPNGHCKHIQATLANLDKAMQKQLAAEQAELLQLWNVMELQELPDLDMQTFGSRSI